MRPKTEIINVLDEAGNKRRVTKTIEYIPNSTISGTSWDEGLPEYTLDNGSPVNVREDGTLIDARTGKKLRRVD